MSNTIIPKQPQKTPGIKETQPMGAVVATQQQVEAKPQLVAPPAPTAGKKGEPFVGREIAAQIGRISMLNGLDPESGTVAYTRKLSETDRFDKVGIFFEAECKLTLIDDADADTVKARVLQAGDTGSLESVFPKGYTGPFSNFTCAWDRPNSREGAHFHDMYGDDVNGSAGKARCQIRERKIGDTQDGKFESKLPAVDIQGTAVLGRLECAKSTGPTRRTKESIVADAAKVIDEMNSRGLVTPDSRAAYVATLQLELKENPLVLLAVEVSDFDPHTYADRMQIDDVRHQLVIRDVDGKDAFLLTLDYVTATRIETGKSGSFVEFEIERMDGATNSAGLSELIELQAMVGKALGLTKSPAPKNARGWMVTE